MSVCLSDPCGRLARILDSQSPSTLRPLISPPYPHGTIEIPTEIDLGSPKTTTRYLLCNAVEWSRYHRLHPQYPVKKTVSNSRVDAANSDCMSLLTRFNSSLGIDVHTCCPISASALLCNPAAQYLNLNSSLLFPSFSLSVISS
jgi:hypothetical protein